MSTPRLAAPAIVLAAVAAACIAVPRIAAAAPADGAYVRHYFDEPLPLPLDVTRIAVYVPGGTPPERASALVERGFDGRDVEPMVKHGWSRAVTPDAVRTADDVEALVATLAGDGFADFVSPVFLDSAGDPLVVTGELLIRFEEGFRGAHAEGVMAALVPGEIVYADWANMPGAYRVRVTSRDGFEVLALANALAVRPDVRWAEPNMIAQCRDELMPNDPNFFQQWAHRNTGQFGGAVIDFDMDSDLAWDITTGAPNVVVVVIDDGVQQDHPDINQLAGADFTGNGTGGGPANQCDNHGTNVAGCVSAIINNNLGVVGVAPNCRVRSAKYNESVVNADCSGGGSFSEGDFVDALAWAVNVGARVTNTSSSFDPASAITDAFQASHSAGLVHFASAGNNSNNSINYPSSLNTVESIVALDPDGTLSGFSNSGPGTAYAAPGSSILTTDRTGNAGNGSGDYNMVNGTSFASPYAAGVAALVISMDQSLLPGEVLSIMAQSSQDLGDAGNDDTFGWGLVNAHQAVLDTVCYAGAGNCFLPHANPGCEHSECCNYVCAEDEYCCNNEWDADCAALAVTLCGGCGTPGAGSCFFPGGNGTPGCSDGACCSTVCGLAPACCDIAWDAACAALATNLCPPVNDACSAAIPVYQNTTYEGDLTAATNDGGATCGTSSTNRDAWYKFTAPCNGTLHADTCGTHDGPGVDAGMDTVLSVHGGCPGTTGNQYACNDDASPPCAGDSGSARDSAVSVTMTAGQTRWLRVSHWGSTGLDDGHFFLNIEFEPTNDLCENALPLSGAGATFCTTGAHTDGPSPCGQLGNDVWFKYTAPYTAIVDIPFCPSDYDTVVAVYEGCSCDGDLMSRLITCNDDACSFQSWVSFQAIVGECYLIQVGGYQGDTGPALITSVFPSQPNDDCHAAVATGPGTVPYSNAGATNDGPDPCGLEFGRDVWFDYTAASTGTVTVGNCGSNHDSIIAAYEGCACPVDAGSMLACSDDDCGLESQITFPVVAGQCYKIQVGGVFAVEGTGTLEIIEDGACIGDSNGDLVIDVTDLVNVILDWGTNGSGHGGDVDGSGLADVGDLVAVVLGWGTC